MDRFTYRDNGVAVLRHDLSPAQHLYQSVERLAAYEDTGLTPEEIIAMKAERDAAAPAGGTSAPEEKTDATTAEKALLRAEAERDALRAVCDRLMDYVTKENRRNADESVHSR